MRRHSSATRAKRPSTGSTSTISGGERREGVRRRPRLHRDGHARRGLGRGATLRHAREGASRARRLHREEIPLDPRQAGGVRGRARLHAARPPRETHAEAQARERRRRARQRDAGARRPAPHAEAARESAGRGPRREHPRHARGRPRLAHAHLLGRAGMQPRALEAHPAPARPVARRPRGAHRDRRRAGPGAHGRDLPGRRRPLRDDDLAARPVMAGRRAALAAWLAGLALCAGQIAHTRFVADLSAFLPAAPTPEQRFLVDQLRDGALSRVMLVGIEGGDAGARAKISAALARVLGADARFASVTNGAAVGWERERDLLLANRYALSPDVSPARFTVEGLRAAIGDTVDLLAPPAGLMLKALVPRDPTREMLATGEMLTPAQAPRLAEGVWASPDGGRALLLARTPASGSDIDAQAQRPP